MTIRQVHHRQGTGWYVTDYADKNKGKPAESEGSEAASKETDKKTDKKTETKKEKKAS